MLIELIEMLLGAVHEFVSPEFIPLVDAIAVPVYVGIILIFICCLICRLGSQLCRTVWGGNRQ